MIRNNYEINENETAEIKRAKVLETLGIVELEKTQYTYCPWKSCNYQIEVQNGVQETDCPSCQRSFTPLKISIVSKMKISENGVFSFLEKQLEKYVPSRNADENIIQIKKNEKEIKIVIMDYCLNTYLFEPTIEDGVLRIIVDDVKNGAIVKGVEKYKFLFLENIINDPETLEKCINQIHANNGLQNIITHEKEMQTFIINLDRQGVKLEKFTKKLCEYIQNNREVVHKFIAGLERDKDNIWGSAIVRLAGPSQPDLIQISLHDYLQEFLQSNKDFECKSWPNSTLGPNNLGSMYTHLKKTGIVGCNLITIAKKISPELWETVRNNNSPKIILIDKFILMRILNGIDAWKLLCENN